MNLLRRLLSFASFTSFAPSLPSARPDASPRGRIAASFREWAHAHGLQVRAHANLLVMGRIAGRDVTVDPGLDGAHPGWVVVTVAAALSSVKPIFVTRVTRTPDFATTRIRALFEDPDLGPELRAISVGPHYVRLRLAPGASPRVVEHAVHAVGDAMRAIYAAPESEPRHSCITTVPYPG